MKKRHKCGLESIDEEGTLCHFNDRLVPGMSIRTPKQDFDIGEKRTADGNVYA